MRHRGQGRLAWEVDEASGRVTRVLAWDTLGRLAWDETRTYARQFGRDVLVGRSRVLPGGELTETLAWAPRTTTVAAAETP